MTDDPTRQGADQGREAQPRGPGSRLKEQREALGLPLEQAAQELRMLREVLRALEEDRYEVLEAPIFVRGHLRNYARLLNLPVDEIVEAYERTRPGQGTPALKLGNGRGPAMDAGTPAWVFPVAWLVLLTMLVLGGLWWYAGPHREPLGDRDSVRDPAVSAIESDADSMEPGMSAVEGERAEVNEDGLPAEGASAEDGALLSVSEDPFFAEPVIEGEAAGQPEPEAGGGEPMVSDPVGDDAPGPLEEVDPAERQSLRLALSEDSWIEIYDADDRSLFYGLAPEGDVFSVTGRAPISVFMGNAPAVTVTVDGEQVDFAQRIRRDNTARITVARQGN